MKPTQAIMTVDELAYAYGKPEGRAGLKTRPEDFIVTENLSFQPLGEGTHAYLYIQKKEINTHCLARQLARFANVPLKEIGYAGLKDKLGITRQWFSVNLQGIEEPQWNNFDLDGSTILSHTYHKRKLKRGSIKTNCFELLLRGIEQQAIPDIQHRMMLVQQTGAPNYFASQRFGHQHNNLLKAIAWFSGQQQIKKREEKSIILSAARSMLFNIALSQRISRSGWNHLFAGEVMNINNSGSIFKLESCDDTTKTRFNQGEIHPTAPLWGKGPLQSQTQLLSMEQELSCDWGFWCRALENRGLKQQRRAIRIIPEDLSYEIDGDKLLLSFCLPAGAYATAVLRELVMIR